MLVADDSDQVICLEVATQSSQWQLQICGEHHGTPTIPMALWDAQRALVIGLGASLHFLRLDDGTVMAKQTLLDELYVSDLMVEATRSQLIVATGRSLLLYETASRLSWEARDIASDGVVIRETGPETVVVACEEPGDEVSIKRFEWDVIGLPVR